MEIDSGAGGEYRLSSQLVGHEDDARGICICGDAGIATSSRDRTVQFWVPDSDRKGRYVVSKKLVGHSSFVGPLAWIPPNEHLVEGGIVSGGMDKLVILWDLHTGVAKETMRGHTSQVTGVAIDENGDIVSSSMDCTLRRWRKGECVEVWEAHKAAVQAVLKLSMGEFITGSSDSTLKLWKGRVCLHTYAGHSDTVRGLASMPGIGILSASHDWSIKLWALTGEVLMEMVGHSSLVYCVAAHSSGLIASGSEDCFLKLWKGGVCVQSIKHPGCVWDAKFFENGDLVTACSDGVVRIWTSSNDRVSDAHELEAYEMQLSHYKLSRKTVGGLKLAELPGLEMLEVPGTSDGQTLIIREGDNGVAYSWNSKESKWDKIGEVVDGPGTANNGQALDGVHYDFVFDVDIGDGQPMRKLPYNKSENPYEVADKWLLKENLPLSYRQQVVEFIQSNSGQSSFVPNSSFRDPYTGGSAYVPGQPSVSSGTGQKHTFKHIPKKGMLFFDSAPPFDGILKKLSEFNSSLRCDPVHQEFALSENEMSRMAAVVNVLRDTSHYHSTTFQAADVSVLLKLLSSWPRQMLFPGIDILRIFILHPEGAAALQKLLHGEQDVLKDLFQKATQDSTQHANVLTTIRTITNLFRHACFRQWLMSNFDMIMDSLALCRSTFNKTADIAYATMILNYSVLYIELQDKERQAQVLSAAVEIAEDTNRDSASRYRGLVAVGTLMKEGAVKSIALQFDALSIAKSAKASTDQNVAEVGLEIIHLCED